jgi:hypothetical protein
MAGMSLRELRVTSTQKPIGSVTVINGKLSFQGAAGDVFAGLRTRLGDAKLAAKLTKDGWSNGYLYLADEEK